MATAWVVRPRQRLAIWLAAHGMPTFARLAYRYWMYLTDEPQFVGKMPPRRDWDIVP